MNTRKSDELHSKITAYQDSRDANGYDDSVELLQELETLLISALENQPNNISYINYLASAKLDLNNAIDVSIKILTDFLHTYEQQLSDDDKARTHTNIAYYYMDSGDEQELINLKQAEECRSKYHQTYYAMGMCYFGNENFEQAERYLLKAVNLYNARDYVYNYATALYSSGNYEKAKELFLSADITHEDTILSLAKCAAKLGEKTQSIKYLQQLERRKSNFENIDEYDIAKVFYEMGEYEAYYNVFLSIKNDYYLADSFDCFYVLFTLKKYTEL